MERSASQSTEGLTPEANVITASVMLRGESVAGTDSAWPSSSSLPVPPGPGVGGGPHPFPSQRLSASPLPIWLHLGESGGLGCLSLQGDG